MVPNTGEKSTPVVVLSIGGLLIITFQKALDRSVSIAIQRLALTAIALMMDITSSNQNLKPQLIGGNVKMYANDACSAFRKELKARDVADIMLIFITGEKSRPTGSSS